VKVTISNGKHRYGPGVDIDLTGSEIACAIESYLVAHGVYVFGARTHRVNGDLIESGYIYVDPDGHVIDNGTIFSGNGAVKK